MHSELKKHIGQLLSEYGFIAVGFSKAGPVDFSCKAVFENWLKTGCQADMKWIEENKEKRFDPTLLHHGTNTIISMLHPWPETVFDSGEMKIAAYAHGSDYHDFLREKSKPVLQLLAEADKNFKPRFFTDSGPVFDRYWAWKAGLGFIGKNGFLIHPQYGSRVFLAHIFTSLDIETAENQLSNACGNCTRCLDSCPTNAFNCNGTVDARKCIAYWFIENKDEIPQEIIDKNPGWIFGCDICQQACPFNQKPIVSAASVEMKGNWTVPASVQEWLEMSEEEFRNHFEKTPLKRAGLAKIKNSILQLANK